MTKKRYFDNKQWIILEPFGIKNRKLNADYLKKEKQIIQKFKIKKQEKFILISNPKTTVIKSKNNLTK